MLFNPAKIFYDEVVQATSEEELIATLNQEVKMKPSFIVACLSFFGLKEGQSKLEFGQEVKALSPQDKQDIYAGFQKLGIECEPPIQPSLEKQAA